MSFLRWPTANAIHMITYGDDFWFYSIPSGEIMRPYYQKVQFTDIFYFQFQCSSDSLTTDMVRIHIDKLINKKQGTPIWQPVKENIYWNKVTTAAYTGYTNYEISGYWGLPEGYYFFRLDVMTGTGAMVQLISEPIYIRSVASPHKDTILIGYANEFYNEGDIIFSTGYFHAGGTMFLRVDGGLKSEGFTPGGIYKMNENLDGSMTLLNQVPRNTYRFTFGSSVGIPNYQVDIVNRVLSLREIFIGEMNKPKQQYLLNQGAKPSRSGDKQHPMAGWDYELVFKNNNFSSEFEAIKQQYFTVDLTTPDIDNLILTTDQIFI